MEEIKNEKAETKTKLTDKEKERLAKEKEKQKEKERLAKEKEKQKEKERLAKEKEKQKEKERLAKEKEKQKEKERLAKEKEKQKEKERLAKEKEKQKNKIPEKKQIVLTPKDGVEAKPLVSRVVSEEKPVVTLSDEVDEKELANIKENESKDSLNKMQAIMEARQKLNSGVVEKPSGKESKIKLGKIVLEEDEEETESKELQELKNRSNAQKALENEVMGKKENDLQAKLREASAQYGGLDALEEPTREKKEAPSVNNAKVEMLQAQVEDLEESLEVLNEALDNAENLEFEGIRVCDPETFELSDEFINYINSLKESQSKFDSNELEKQISEKVEEVKNEYSEKLKQATEANAEVVKEKNELNKLLVQKENDYLTQLEQKDQKVKELNDLLESETVKKASVDASITQLSEKLEVLNEELEAKVNNITELLEKKTALEEELNTLEIENKKLNEDVEVKQSNITELLEKKTALESENGTLQASNNLLEEKLSLLEEESSNKITKEEAQVKLDEGLRDFINKCNALTVDKANLNTKLDEKEAELTSSKEAYSKLESELNEKIVLKEKESLELSLQITSLKAELDAKNTSIDTPSEDTKEEIIEEKEEKKPVVKQIGKFFIDSFNGMAHGLFATLIIGVIICQIGSLFKAESIFNTSLNSIGSGLKLLMGVGIGIGIARSLKLDGIKLVGVAISGGICAYLQNPSGFGANADPLTIYIVVVLTYLFVKFVLRKTTPVDVIIVPLITAIISGVLTLLIGDYVKLVTTGIGAVVNEATELNPLPYGIIISVIMGMALTAPISSAAIAISIGLEGLAAGAAVVGCATQMVGFAIQSIRDNNIGKVVSVGIGTSMLQFKNILKHPIIWLPTILASAILGPISTMVFKLECSPSGAGMGTSGLVGVLQVFDVMGFTPTSIIGVILLMIVAPAGLVFVFDLILRKLNLIKPKDLEF